jgi:hypothetical protein
MARKETYSTIRAWLSYWGAYLRFALTGEDETDRAIRDAEKLVELKTRQDYARCKREFQAEVAKSLEEDEIRALLLSEAHEGFEDWLKAERQKERDAKKAKRPTESK